MVELGNKIRNLRKKSNFTQEQLAHRLGLTKSIISAYENGSRLPSYEALITLARIFHVSTDYLLGLENINTIDLSGLSIDEIDALKNLIRTMKQA